MPWRLCRLPLAVGLFFTLASCAKNVLVVTDPYYAAMYGEPAIKRSLQAVASANHALVDVVALRPSADGTSDVVRVAVNSRAGIVVLTPFFAPGVSAITSAIHEVDPEKTVVLDAAGTADAALPPGSYVRVVFERTEAMHDAGDRAAVLARSRGGPQTGPLVVFTLTDSDTRRAELAALKSGITAGLAGGAPGSGGSGGGLATPGPSGTGRAPDSSDAVRVEYHQYDVPPDRETLRADVLRAKAEKPSVVVVFLGRLDLVVLDLFSETTADVVTEFAATSESDARNVRVSIEDPLSAVVAAALSHGGAKRGAGITVQSKVVAQPNDVQ